MTEIDSPKIQEIRIAAIGNVDSGKTTTVSVLCNDILDDGRGKARSKVLKHSHEGTTGRTSSITHCYKRNKQQDGEKIHAFVDLAGHEKYLKTTMTGLNGCMIDFAMVTIGTNMGVLGTTKEHLGIALALQIPIFIILTKLDICPKPVLEKTRSKISKIMSSKAAGRKKVVMVDDSMAMESVIHQFNNRENICPIFSISNVKGEGVELLKNFVEKLESKRKWNSNHKNSLFLIDDVFKIPGVGTVVSGSVKKGTISKDDKLFLGPFNGKFKKVNVRNIHNNFKENVKFLEGGHSGCFNIKSMSKDTILRNHIKRGMILVKNPKCVISFEAEIMILHHPTTIRVNYQPVVHCGTVRQSAKIVKMSKELVRTGDKANVVFEFLYHPEYIEANSRITFREGKTKGIGKIRKVIYK